MSTGIIIARDSNIPKNIIKNYKTSPIFLENVFQLILQLLSVNSLGQRN